jgi:hypothetical protein
MAVKNVRFLMSYCLLKKMPGLKDNLCCLHGCFPTLYWLDGVIRMPPAALQAFQLVQ